MPTNFIVFFQGVIKNKIKVDIFLTVFFTAETITCRQPLRCLSTNLGQAGKSDASRRHPGMRTAHIRDLETTPGFKYIC